MDFVSIEDRIKSGEIELPLDSFAFPGGYPLVYITEEFACLCPDCANKGVNERIEQANDENLIRYDGDNLLTYFVHYEGEAIICDGCNSMIESAYGEIEE